MMNLALVILPPSKRGLLRLLLARGHGQIRRRARGVEGRLLKELEV